MGAIESTEAGNFFERAAEELTRGMGYREDESYRGYRFEEEASVRGEETPPVAASSPSPAKRGASPSPAQPAAGPSPARQAASPASAKKAAGPSPARRAASPSPAAAAASAAAANAANQSEITIEAETPGHSVEHSSSKTQKPNRVAPAEGKSKSKAEAIRVSRRCRLNIDAIFSLLFVLHLLLVITGIMFLIVVYLKDMTERKFHNLQRWFPQLTACVVLGSLFASLWQTMFRAFPNFMSQAVLWTSAFLTFAASIMLISTSRPAALGVGVIWLLFAICLTLYACWVFNRVEYVGDLMACSLKTARKVRGVYVVSFWILLVSSLWLVFWSFGIVSALTFKFGPLIIFGLIVSLAWTLETFRNVVYTAVARGIATVYVDGQHTPHFRWKLCMRAVFTSLFGSVCLGSLIVPSLHSLRVVARGVNKLHGGNDFMFSCSGWFLGCMTSLERHANNWGYVQVGMYRKPFQRASEDTWDLFKSKRLNVVIETDLTSSVCVLSGVAGGMLCVVVIGGWTFGTYKPLTMSISIVCFIIGYFLMRITMAVPQGAVSTHYVCYAENSTGQEFSKSPVGERLKELFAERENPVANEV